MPEQTLRARLVAEVAQFERNMKAAADTTKKTAREMLSAGDSAKEAGSAFDSLGLDTSELTDGFARLEQNTRDAGAANTDMGQTASTLGGSLVAVTAVVGLATLAWRTYTASVDEARAAGARAVRAVVDLNNSTAEELVRRRDLILAYAEQQRALDFNLATYTRGSRILDEVIDKITGLETGTLAAARANDSLFGAAEALTTQIVQLGIEAEITGGALRNMAGVRIPVVNSRFGGPVVNPNFGALVAAAAGETPRTTAAGSRAPGQRTIQDVLSDLRTAQAATQALFELGVIQPAAAAQAAAKNLLKALNAALNVTSGVTTAEVRGLADELIRARIAAKPERIITFKEEARALRNELEQVRLKMLAVKIAAEALGKGLGAPVISFESVADAAKKAKASLGDFTTFATSQADEIKAAVLRITFAAERISSVVGDAFGAAAFGFLSGPGISDAARALEEFQSGINANALREQFFEGIIGAEEFSLRMAVLIEQQQAFQAQFSPLTRAAQGFFTAFSQGIKQLLAEIVAAIAKTIVFRAILTALGGNPASFVTVLGSILGVPTAGSVGGGGVGALGHLTAGTVAAAAFRGPQQVSVSVRMADGGHFRGGYYMIPVEAFVDGFDQGVHLLKRTGGRI